MIDFFAQNLWLLWLLVTFICLILELTNGDFFIMCFAIGGLVATLFSACCDSLVWQIVLFAVVTLLSIFFVRPTALRYFYQTKEHRVSNTDALIGRVGRVTEAIEANGYGRVKIDGDSWKAQTADHQALSIDTNVKIIGIDSVIITVEPAL